MLEKGKKTFFEHAMCTIDHVANAIRGKNTRKR